MNAIFFVLSFLPFYLLGAFPSGKLIAKLKGVEIEKHGSGNVGATNVARVLGRGAGVLTLLLDVIKGFLAVLVADLLTSDLEFVALCGIAVVLGHCFSIPGVLKGGKGVATTAGVYLYLSPALLIVGVVCFAAVLFYFQIVSLASMTAAMIIPISAFFFQLPEPIQLASTAIALLIVLRHKDNLVRLAEGREKRFDLGGQNGKQNGAPAAGH